MSVDETIARPTRTEWGLAAVVLGTVVALTWYGYRATAEWQTSSAVLVERRERDLASVLTTALTRDMRGVQISVLGGRDWNSLYFEPPYEIDDVVATAFARYPYPDTFFGWRADDADVLFFTRADRPPRWAPESGKGAHYPVVMSRNVELGGMLRSRVAREFALGRDYSAFDTTLEKRRYQVVARLVYHDPMRQRLDCVFGFTVDLDWARQHYFPAIAQQAAHVGSANEGLEYAIADEQGLPIASPGPLVRSPVVTHTFARLFLDPALVALDPPTDLRQPVWKITVGAGPDSALDLAARGSQRTLVAVSVAALVAGLGLVVTLRAAHASARIAAMRSDFVSAVTHELKTPLSTIRTIADTLVRGRLNRMDQVETYAELLVQEERRLSRLVENLLAYARVTDVAEVYSFEPVAPQEIVADALARFGRQLADGGFDVDVSVPASLPHVKADRTSVVLALDNLIDNAIRYSRHSTTASVTVRCADENVEFAVRDHGIGIAPDELERVQRRFVRGRSSTSHGSGLGLAIVRRIALDHGGDLRIDSEVGVGTVVTLVIPATIEGHASVEANSHR
jgi:signal transduction histidine kinase